MDIGLYAAASSGVLQMKKLEVQNNNLANINTVGFKGQYIVPEMQSFDSTLASSIQDRDPYARGDQLQVPNVSQVKTQIDFSPGGIHRTGNPLDVALRAPLDFFVVNTPQGPLYTRAGNFTLNANSELVTQDGLQVQGDGGAINVQGLLATITPDGSVRAGNQTVGRLRVVRFENQNGLVAVEGARFRAVGAQPLTVEPRMEPQSLEMSNVSAITGMVDLITTNRAFDAYTKAAQSLDTLNQTAISQVGRRQP
jgi:flagellar basal-body rod protein FlgF